MKLSNLLISAWILALIGCGLALGVLLATWVWLR